MSKQDRIFCTVYRSSREKELYLYVDKQEDLSRVPEELIERMGETSVVMGLILTPEKKLARVKTKDVISAILEKGYFLQLPPDFQPAIFTLGE